MAETTADLESRITYLKYFAKRSRKVKNSSNVKELNFD